MGNLRFGLSTRPRPERDGGGRVLGLTRRPLSSSFLWIIFRILLGKPKKELLRGLGVGPLILHGVLQRDRIDFQSLPIQTLATAWPISRGGRNCQRPIVFAGSPRDRFTMLYHVTPHTLLGFLIRPPIAPIRPRTMIKNQKRGHLEQAQTPKSWNRKQLQRPRRTALLRIRPL